MKTLRGSKAEHKAQAEHRYGKHSPVLSFAIAWVGYLGEAAPSWELLGVSVIGTGAEHRPLQAALSGSLLKAPALPGDTNQHVKATVAAQRNDLPRAIERLDAIGLA